MNKFTSFGSIVLNVSTQVLAKSQSEALQKIYALINELNANIRNIDIETIDGTVHRLNVDNFHIEWEDVE
ncbi:Uncharacterised protein [[Flavobacterium] thermophilum]|nr:Uncharacterised protein [[Flavobacterium] thermophilum]